MIHPLADQDRQERIGLLVGIAIVSVMLWQTGLGMMLLYPFTILATWFHEMGHGLAAMLTGAHFERLVIYPDGSGVAQYFRDGGGSRLLDVIVAAGGPLGPPLAGAGLIVASGSHSATRRALTVLGGALLLSCVIWVRSIAGLLVLPVLGVVILWGALRGSAPRQRFAIQLLGVQACISVWQHLGYLFTDGGEVAGQLHRSDTGAIADALLLPHWFWGGLISVAIALLMTWSLRVALRR